MQRPLPLQEAPPGPASSPHPHPPQRDGEPRQSGAACATTHQPLLRVTVYVDGSYAPKRGIGGAAAWFSHTHFRYAPVPPFRSPSRPQVAPVLDPGDRTGTASACPEPGMISISNPEQSTAQQQQPQHLVCASPKGTTVTAQTAATASPWTSGHQTTGPIPSAISTSTAMGPLRAELYAALLGAHVVFNEMLFDVRHTILVIKQDSEGAIALLTACLARHLPHGLRPTRWVRETAQGRALTIPCWWGEPMTAATIEEHGDILDRWWSLTQGARVHFVWVKAHRQRDSSDGQPTVGLKDHGTAQTTTSTTTTTTTLSILPTIHLLCATTDNTKGHGCPLYIDDHGHPVLGTPDRNIGQVRHCDLASAAHEQVVKDRTLPPQVQHRRLDGSHAKPQADEATTKADIEGNYWADLYARAALEPQAATICSPGGHSCESLPLQKPPVSATAPEVLHAHRMRTQPWTPECALWQEQLPRSWPPPVSTEAHGCCVVVSRPRIAPHHHHHGKRIKAHHQKAHQQAHQGGKHQSSQHIQSDQHGGGDSSSASGPPPTPAPVVELPRLRMAMTARGALCVAQATPHPDQHGSDSSGSSSKCPDHVKPRCHPHQSLVHAKSTLGRLAHPERSAVVTAGGPVLNHPHRPRRPNGNPDPDPRGDPRGVPPAASATQPLPIHKLPNDSRRRFPHPKSRSHVDVSLPFSQPPQHPHYQAMSNFRPVPGGRAGQRVGHTIPPPPPPPYPAHFPGNPRFGHQGYRCAEQLLAPHLLQSTLCR